MATKKSVTLFYDGLAWVQTRVKYLFALGPRLRSPLAVKLAVGAAFLIYFIAQSFLSVGPIFLRESPVEPDDAYSYIVKATELQAGCFSRECPALTSLRDQLQSPTQNLESAAIRHRQYHRIFYFYHPLHSVVLSTLENAGLTWEQAYDTLWIAGKILIALAVSFWLISLWGPAAGGLGLLLLSLYIVAGQGLHVAVPSNLALAIGLILWARIYRHPERSTWLLVALVAVLLLMHPIGRVYSMLVIAFLLLSSPWPPKGPVAISAAISTLLVLSSFAIPKLISQPELDFNPASFFPGNWSYLVSLNASFGSTMRTVEFWSIPFGGIVGVIVLLAIGLIANSRRNQLSIVFLLIALLILFGSLYVVPFYGALLFERFWPLFALFVVGAVSQAIITIVTNLQGLSHGLKTKGSQAIMYRGRGLSQKGWKICILVIGSALLVFGITRFYIFAAGNYAATYEHLTNTGDIAFNNEQVGLMTVPEGNQTQTVLYMDELSFYYYLTHGALEHEAIYYPAVVGTAEQKTWLLDRQFDYLVARNPIYSLPVSPLGELILAKDESLVLRADDPLEVGNLQFLMSDRDEELSLTITLISGSERDDVEVVIPPGPSGWFFLDETIGDAERISIRIRQSDQPLILQGIRLDQNEVTNWPWNENITLIFRSASGEESEVIFNAGELSKTLDLDLEVVDDRGYSLLARVAP